MIFLFVFSNIGCASIGVRTGAYRNQFPIYPATSNDVAAVCYAVAMPFRSPMDRDAQDGLTYLFAPVAIIDFPLAVAVDTLLLPYDIYKLQQKNRNANDESGSEIASDGPVGRLRPKSVQADAFSDLEQNELSDQP